MVSPVATKQATAVAWRSTVTAGMARADLPPVAVQGYPGVKGDPATVAEQAETLRQRCEFERVVPVGDRGLLTETQIKYLKRHPGLGWISALRHMAIRQLVETQAVQLSIFDERHLAEIRTEANPGERLVVCYYPVWGSIHGTNARICWRSRRRSWPRSPDR